MKKVFYVIAVILIIIGVFYICREMQYKEYVNHNDAIGVLGDVTESMQVIQSFEAETDYLKSISIFFFIASNYESGRTKIEITDEKNNILKEVILDITKLNTDEYHLIELELALKKGNRYNIVVSKLDGEGDANIFIKDVDGSNKALFINGEKIEYELMIKYMYGSYEYYKIVIWIILVCALLVIICMDFSVNENIKNRIVDVFFFLSPFIDLVIIEGITGNLTNMFFRAVILTYVLFLALCGFFVVVFQSRSKGIFFSNIMLMVLGMINYYTYTFRGMPFVPWDLYSTKTAIAVISGYELNVSINMMLALFAFGICNVAILKIDNNKRRIVKKWNFKRTLLCSAIITCGLYALIIEGKVTRSCFKITDDMMAEEAFKHNGFWVNFIMNVKYMVVDKPKGYDRLKVQNMLEDYGETSLQIYNDVLPDIVIIMNESFADISKLGKIETNMEVMPFIDSLKNQNNVIAGNAYVSVFGGNTANTEFEFLTNCSMAFMPKGSIPYSKYIRGEKYSVCHTLKNLGYKTIAIHPANKENWNRENVYQDLGFDTFLSMSEFKELNNSDFVRGNISDKCTYNKIVQLIENNDTGNPLFIFDVTIQNHGGYNLEGYTAPIKILNGSKDDLKDKSKQAAEQYLSLIHESDAQFEELLQYFKKREQPTIILFFGDHWPALGHDFYGFIAGKDFDTFDNNEINTMYSVPFVCWANYDIKKIDVKEIGMNYLSNIIFESTGIRGGEVNNFLEELYKEVPVININGFMDKNGNCYDLNNQEMQNKTKEYQWLQYSIMFDGGSS